MASVNPTLALWRTLMLLGLLIPFVLMLALGWSQIDDRVRGLVSYATICLPGIALITSIIGEQMESGRIIVHVNEFVSLFAYGAILFIFVGVGALGITGPNSSPSFNLLVNSVLLTMQVVVTLLVVLAGAKIKAGLMRTT